MNRVPDPASSRAILIGCSSFTQPWLPAIPAVKHGLVSLDALLTHAEAGIIPAEHCQVIHEPQYLLDVGTPLARAARDATDLLLVYYSGHGVLNDQGQLYLTLGETDPDTLPYSALSFETLRNDMVGSAAAVRILILDCCFSGRAIEALSNDQSLIDGQLQVAGTYTLSSTTANAPAHAPVGEQYTAFTGALIRALEQPTVSTLDEVYKKVDADLRADGRPRPQRRAVNNAGDLVLSKGVPQRPSCAAQVSMTARFGTGTGGGPDEAHFRRSQEVVLSSWRGGWISTDAIGTTISVFFSFVAEWWVASIVGLITLLSIALTAAVWNNPFTEPDELVISSSGVHVLTGTEKRCTFPWHHILAIGIMAPMISTPSPNQKSTAPPSERPSKPVLVVRLRPEAPDPDTNLRLLTRDHNQLGYFGVCHLDTVDATREDINAALERFAGARMVRSAREFLHLDPRLRPNMA